MKWMAIFLTFIFNFHQVFAAETKTIGPAEAIEIELYTLACPSVRMTIQASLNSAYWWSVYHRTGGEDGILGGLWNTTRRDMIKRLVAIAVRDACKEAFEYFGPRGAKRQNALEYIPETDLITLLDNNKRNGMEKVIVDAIAEIDVALSKCHGYEANQLAIWYALTTSGVSRSDLENGGRLADWFQQRKANYFDLYSEDQAYINKRCKILIDLYSITNGNPYRAFLMPN